MCQKDMSLPRRINALDYVVVNQTSFAEYPNLNSFSSNSIFFSTEERGLSNSRNTAISLATADICLLADDDLVYHDAYIDIVVSAYEKYKEADLILFDFDEPDSLRKRKTIKKNAGRLNFLTILRGNSVRISFKLEVIKRNKIQFNCNFGAGSGKFICGEDSVFLLDCLRAGLRIYYVPTAILTLCEETRPSSWFSGFNAEYYRSKGAFSFHFLKNAFLLYNLQYLLRHNKEKSELSFIQKFISMYKGALDYRRICLSKNRFLNIQAD